MDLTKLSDSELQSLYSKTKNDISRFSNMQLAKKVQLNSAYGATGSKYFRYYDVRIAESITLSGQLAIRHIEKKMNLFLNKFLNTEDIDYVVAGDTDSLLLNLGPIIKKNSELTDVKSKINYLDGFFKDTIEPYLAECYDQLAKNTGCPKNKLYMKREKICERAIFGGKKRYCLKVWDSEGVRFNEADLIIKGFETQRSSTPKLCRDRLFTAFNILLNEDEEAIQNFISKFKKEFVIKRDYSPEEIATPGTANNLNKYSDRDGNPIKGCPMHVYGALMHNSLVTKLKLSKKIQKINEGDKIRYILLEKPNTLNSHVISFIDELPVEFNLHQYIDYEAQFDKIFGKPLKKITEIVGFAYEKPTKNILF